MTTQRLSNTIPQYVIPETPCVPPCVPRHNFIGSSWWKRLGYGSACGCAYHASDCEMRGKVYESKKVVLKELLTRFAELESLVLKWEWVNYQFRERQRRIQDREDKLLVKKMRDLGFDCICEHCCEWFVIPEGLPFSYCSHTCPEHNEEFQGWLKIQDVRKKFNLELSGELKEKIAVERWERLTVALLEKNQKKV